jgi:hypothetical protein
MVPALQKRSLSAGSSSNFSAISKADAVRSILRLEAKAARRGIGLAAQAFENKRSRKSPKIHLAGGRGRDTQIVVRKAKSSPSSRRCCPGGTSGSDTPMECRRSRASGPSAPPAFRFKNPNEINFHAPQNKRGVRGDLAIGRCPGGTKGSLTPHEDRPGPTCISAPDTTLPQPGFAPSGIGMAASRQAKLGFALGWTCFARQLGPWSGRPPRSTDRGLPHRARVPASPFPDTPDPCQPPCVRADPEPCASLDQTAASCPALSLSSLARRFRPPQVLRASRAPPAVAAERTGSLQNPCFPTQPEPMPEGADPSAPFVSPWRGLALGEPDDRRDTNELLHPRADFRPHPVQPLLKTLNCPFRPRRNAFRRRLLPVDGASALG